MLMDVSLRETYEKAKSGDKEAMFDVIYALNFGINTPKDEILARELLVKFVDDDVKDISRFEYGKLYKAVGHFFAEVNNPRKSKEYFIKARDFILETYLPEYADELINKYDLGRYILEQS